MTIRIEELKAYFFCWLFTVMHTEYRVNNYCIYRISPYGFISAIALILKIINKFPPGVL